MFNELNTNVNIANSNSNTSSNSLDNPLSPESTMDINESNRSTFNSANQQSLEDDISD